MPARRQPAAPEVPLEIWRELLDAAVAFRAVAPWRWMTDSDVFALIDESGRPWFPTVLGAARQVFGVAFYRGESGLRFLLEKAELVVDDPRAAMFEQDALVLDWGGKKHLVREDLAVLRALGHVPRPGEKNAWPSFRSHAPGWFPWFLTADEARSLARATRALIACAEMVKGRPDFWLPSEEDRRRFPTIEIATALSGQPVKAEHFDRRLWHLEPLPPPPFPAMPPSWGEIVMRPKAPGTRLEFDIVHVPNAISDGGRPYFPRMAIMADGETGYLYAAELIGMSEPWGQIVTDAWTKALTSLQRRPEFITIRRWDWEPTLRTLAGKLGIGLEIAEELPFVDEARDSFAQFGMH